MVLISPSPRFINERGYAGGFEQKNINEQLADSRLVVIETNGHLTHLSAPQQTLSAMDHFLHHETVL